MQIISKCSHMSKPFQIDREGSSLSQRSLKGRNVKILPRKLTPNRILILSFQIWTKLNKKWTEKNNLKLLLTTQWDVIWRTKFNDYFWSENIPSRLWIFHWRKFTTLVESTINLFFPKIQLKLGVFLLNVAQLVPTVTVLSLDFDLIRVSKP